MESRDGAVEIALHQCVPGVASGLVAMWVKFVVELLLRYSAPRGFSPGSPAFPFPQKPSFLHSNSIGSRVTLKTTGPPVNMLASLLINKVITIIIVVIVIVIVIVIVVVVIVIVIIIMIIRCQDV